MLNEMKDPANKRGWRLREPSQNLPILSRGELSRDAIVFRLNLIY